MFKPRKLLTLWSCRDLDGEMMVALLEASEKLGLKGRAVWKDAMGLAWIGYVEAKR